MSYRNPRNRLAANAPTHAAWARSRIAASLAALALAACSTAPAPVAKVDEEAVARYRAGGYGPPAPLAIESHRISGPVTEAPWTIGLTRPADHQLRPVIIFLPSLGQDDAAPVRWIETWAHAGYAVLVIQPLADDADVWSTPDARSGDFERIARARFADELMADRIARLSRLLIQVRTRSLRSEPGLDGLDWNHLALAGADLGAYTVQSIATAPPPTLAAAAWPLNPQAYLVISPYAVRGAPPVDTAAARAPVMMISAVDDVDAYGVVTDPAIRHLAFDRLVGVDDYYFELGVATHRWLGGAVVLADAPEATPRARPMMSDEVSGGQNRGRRKPGSARDDMAPQGDDEDTAAEKKARTASRLDMLAARSRALTQSALSVTSFEAVSLAFLDAYVRDLPAAHAWLGETAPHWLQDGDRLKHR